MNNAEVPYDISEGGNMKKKEERGYKACIIRVKVGHLHSLPILVPGRQKLNDQRNRSRA